MKRHWWLVGGALAVVIACQRPGVVPPPPAPAPMVATRLAPPWLTDNQWIDSVTRAWESLARSSPPEVAAAKVVSRPKRTQNTVGSALAPESVSDTETLASANGTVGATRPTISHDDTGARAVLAGIGLVSLLTIVALVRRV